MILQLSATYFCHILYTFSPVILLPQLHYTHYQRVDVPHLISIFGRPFNIQIKLSTLKHIVNSNIRCGVLFFLADKYHAFKYINIYILLYLCACARANIQNHIALVRVDGYLCVYICRKRSTLLSLACTQIHRKQLLPKSYFITPRGR